MPQVGDTVPPEFVPASPDELRRLAGRNTLGAGTAPKRRARPPKGRRPRAHAATQTPEHA